MTNREIEQKKLASRTNGIKQLLDAKITEFIAYTSMGDLDAAQEARDKAHTYLDSHLDHCADYIKFCGEN